jgi:predicted RNA-binding Zn ribbon-like protein
VINLPELANDADRRDPAPGDLELLRQFINTADIEERTDEVATPAALAAWYATRGLPAAGRTLTDADLARAIDLRETLREVLQVHGGHPVPAEATARFRDLAASLPLRLEVGPPARLVAADDTDPAVARMLGIAFESMTAGTWKRLKVCRNDACRWAYYDHSRNASGAWCRMAICGNRMKGQRFRARKGSAA